MIRALAAVVAGIVALPVGSFLTVVVHRVPSGSSIVKPRSACPACGSALRGVDNVPVLSYLWRRGKCGSCQAPIPIRYLILELATAVLFVSIALEASSLWMVPAYCALAACLVALTAIDLELFRLPSSIVYAGGLIGAPLLVVASAATGRWSALASAAIAGAAALVLFGALFVAVPRAMGFGDVRLAALCGAFLGWISYRTALAGLLLSFLIAGVVACSLLLARRMQRSGRLAFGPFLAAGTLVAVLFGGRLVPLWLH